MEQALKQLGIEVASVEQSLTDIRSVIESCYNVLDASSISIDQLASAIAKGFVDKSITPRIINSHPTAAGGDIPISDTLAVLHNINGHTLHVNQIVSPSLYPTTTLSGLNRSVSGDYLVIDGTVDSNPVNNINIVQGLSLKDGHVFAIVVISDSPVANIRVRLAAVGSAASDFISSAPAFLFKATYEYSTILANITADVGTRYSNRFRTLIFDLTASFGFGSEPSNIDAFTQEWLGKNASDVTLEDWDVIAQSSAGHFVNSFPKQFICKAADNEWEQTITLDYSSVSGADGKPLFPDGLRSVKDVCCDSLSTDGIATREVDSIDLGTLKSKSISYANGLFVIYNCDFLGFNGNSDLFECSHGYIPDVTLFLAQNTRDKVVMYFSSGKCLYFRNNALNGDIEAFKQSLDGIIMHYPAKTKTTVHIPPCKCYYRVANDATEQIVTDKQSAPVLANISYREAVSASEAIALLAQSSI